MPKRPSRKPSQRIVTQAARQQRESDPELMDIVADAVADMAGREYIGAWLWRINVPLPPPPKDVQARRMLGKAAPTRQERLEQERLALAREEQPRRRGSPDGQRTVTSSWVADPEYAEGDVTIEVRVVGERVELDEADPPIEPRNRDAWNRIQVRHGQSIGLRLDQGMPVVTFADGTLIPGQRAERYGSRPQEVAANRRFPWQVQPGFERMLPLPQAIHLAEQAAIEHGPDIANGKSPKHHAAWDLFKKRLDQLDELWEARKASAQPCFTFDELVTLDREIKDWVGALCDAAMHWVDWPTYSRSDVRKRSWELRSNTQELEKRLHAVASQQGRGPGLTSPAGRASAMSGPLWSLRPFDPDCTERVPADPLVVQAVRLHFGDWSPADPNWRVVRELLRDRGRTPEEIAGMELADIHAALCAVALTSARTVATATCAVATLPAAPEAAPPDIAHSPDFRAVRWHGLEYTFSAKQAAIVRVLWEAMDNGTPDVGDHYLLVDAGSDTRRIADLFREHPAMGTMIVRGATKGTRRLADPLRA